MSCSSQITCFDSYSFSRAHRWRKLRDLANTRRDIRDARGDEALAWITSHNFRKTTATILDQGEFTAREIADQLGHARPSMTQDVHMGRKVRNTRAVSTLDAMLREVLDGQKGE